MTYPVFLGAVVITAANKRIRFKEAAGAVGNVDLALGTYYLRGAYATNLITQSENFSATWSLSANCSATANATPSPNGNGAYLLTMTSAVSSTSASISVTYTGNGTKVVSTFVKRPASNAASITDFDCYDNTAGIDRHIVRITWATSGTPSLSTVVGSGTLYAPTDVGNGWWRVSFTVDGIVAANSNLFLIYPAGIPAATGAVLMWGVQAENATTPGPYVVTTGAIATGPTNELALAIRNGLDAFGGGGNSYTVTASQSIDTAASHTLLTVTRATGTDTFQIVVDGSTTFDMALIGIVATTANDALAKTSTRSCAAAWASNDAYANLEPFSERVASITRAASGRVSGVSRSDRMQSWRVGLGFVHLSRTFVVDALLTAADTLEGFIERFGAGASLEMHDCLLTSGTTMAPRTFSTLVDVVHFSEDALTTYEPQAIGAGVPLYALDLTLHAEVV
jgi:hypothetical protein